MLLLFLFKAYKTTALDDNTFRLLYLFLFKISYSLFATSLISLLYSCLAFYKNALQTIFIS
ncbi:hypothetical protein MBOVb_2230 [Mycoplasmopsis bovis 1067]|nr:hypothetical protein MBOVb_2230 [Mycoplasmopsis bovis 1067]